MLPTDGDLNPGPVEIRFGTPLDPSQTGAPDAARDQVAAMLAAGPPRSAQARSHARLATLAGSGAGAAAAFAWGMAEAVSWPLMAELFLMLLLPAAPRRVWALVPALAAGSVAGVLACAYAARHGVLLRRR